MPLLLQRFSRKMCMYIGASAEDSGEFNEIDYGQQWSTGVEEESEELPDYEYGSAENHFIKRAFGRIMRKRPFDRVMKKRMLGDNLHLGRVTKKSSYENGGGGVHMGRVTKRTFGDRMGRVMKKSSSLGDHFGRVLKRSYGEDLGIQMKRSPSSYGRVMKKSYGMGDRLGRVMKKRSKKTA